MVRTLTEISNKVICIKMQLNARKINYITLQREKDPEGLQVLEIEIPFIKIQLKDFKIQ